MHTSEPLTAGIGGSGSDAPSDRRSSNENREIEQDAASDCSSAVIGPSAWVENRGNGYDNEGAERGELVGTVGDAAEEEGGGGRAAENGLELGFAANVAEGRREGKSLRDGFDA